MKSKPLHELILILGLVFTLSLWVTLITVNRQVERLEEEANTAINQVITRPEVEEEPVETEPEPVKQVVQNHTPAPKPDPVIVTTPAPEPRVEINTGFKNESSGTINIYQQPQPVVATTSPMPEPTPEPVVEEKQLTPLEEAREIALSFDPNATVRMLSENKIRTQIYENSGVTTTLVDGWQDNYRITLRKIK